ncbi:MAG: hypothetical protein EHM55_08435 [Acidobacteria bacterium]|nr:MAG: hypothetical protein EHM55_08435 [Acidobacteriota bacterium]
MSTRDHQVLWEISNDEATTTCVMVSCCTGAELQILRGAHGDEEIILRELYPDRDSLYERARELREEL